MEEKYSRFEILLLNKSVDLMARKLYGMGFCIQREMCRKRIPNCVECIKNNFIDRSLKELCKGNEINKAKS